MRGNEGQDQCRCDALVLKPELWEHLREVSSDVNSCTMLREMYIVSHFIRHGPGFSLSCKIHALCLSVPFLSPDLIVSFVVKGDFNPSYKFAHVAEDFMNCL